MTNSPESLFECNQEWAEATVRVAARRYRICAADLPTCVNGGLIALWDCAQRYDPGRGTPFRTFSIKRVRGAVHDYIRYEAAHFPRYAGRTRAARGMSPPRMFRIKRKDRLWVVGGQARVDDEDAAGALLRWLPPRKLEDVRAAVLDRIATLGAGGGYVLASSHDISADTPAENIVAMYDPALRAI